VDESTGVGTGAEELLYMKFGLGTGYHPGRYFVDLEADGRHVVRRLVLR